MTHEFTAVLHPIMSQSSPSSPLPNQGTLLHAFKIPKDQHSSYRTLKSHSLRHNGCSISLTETHFFIPLKQEPQNAKLPQGVEIVMHSFETSKSPIISKMQEGSENTGDSNVDAGERSPEQGMGSTSPENPTTKLRKHQSVKGLLSTITQTGRHLLKTQKTEPGFSLSPSMESTVRESSRGQDTSSVSSPLHPALDDSPDPAQKTPTPKRSLKLDPVDTRRSPISLSDMRMEYHSPKTPQSSRKRSTAIYAPTHLKKASIHPHATISSNVSIEDNCVVESGARIFASQRSGGIRIGKNCIIKRNAQIINEMPDATLFIGEANMFEPECKVYWSNRRLDHTEYFTAREMQSGMVQIGDQNVLGMRSGVYCSVGSHCCIAPRAEVIQDIGDHCSVWSNGTCVPVRPDTKQQQGTVLFGGSAEEIQKTRQREGPYIIHRTNPSHFEQLEILQRQLGHGEESVH